MPIDAIVRLSFQTNSQANQEAQRAITSSGVFQRVNTAVFSTSKGDDEKVQAALEQLLGVLKNHSSTIDFVSLTLTRHKEATFDAKEEDEHE